MYVYKNQPFSIYLQGLMQNPEDWTVFYNLQRSGTLLMHAEYQSYMCASECPPEVSGVLEKILGVMRVAAEACGLVWFSDL